MTSVIRSSESRSRPLVRLTTGIHGWIVAFAASSVPLAIVVHWGSSQVITTSGLSEEVSPVMVPVWLILVGGCSSGSTFFFAAATSPSAAARR